MYFSRDESIKDKVLQTILYGSSEIKDELRKIFEEILKNKWKHHRDPYYDLSKAILTTEAALTKKQYGELREWMRANLSWMRFERKIVIPLGNRYMDFKVRMVG